MAKIIDVAAIGGMVLERRQESREEPLLQFRRAAAQLEGTGIDLIVTCETMMMSQPVATGEDIEHPGELLNEYITFAKRNHCTVAGALRTIFPDGAHQSIVYYGPDGQYLGAYHKMFPTDIAMQKGTIPGKGAVTVETPAGRLGGALCFDLNFDELRDEYIAQAPDIICFSSYFHGGPVMQNWALRTHAFLVGAIKDIGSEIYDPLGRRLNMTTFYHQVARARINLDRFVMHGSYNSGKYPEIQRKYGKKVLIDHDSPSAFGMLYSCTDEFTAQDIAREFELISAEEYLNSCRQQRLDCLKK